MPAVKPLIVACRPIAVEGGVVTLGFPESQAFLKDAARARRATIEDGIATVSSVEPVRVRFVATNLESLSAAPADADADRLLDRGPPDLRRRPRRRRRGELTASRTAGAARIAQT